MRPPAIEEPVARERELTAPHARIKLGDTYMSGFTHSRSGA
jgi:hypothetical protein